MTDSQKDGLAGEGPRRKVPEWIIEAALGFGLTFALLGLALAWKYWDGWWWGLTFGLALGHVGMKYVLLTRHRRRVSEPLESFLYDAFTRTRVQEWDLTPRRPDTGKPVVESSEGV